MYCVPWHGKSYASEVTRLRPLVGDTMIILAGSLQFQESSCEEGRRSEVRQDCDCGFEDGGGGVNRCCWPLDTGKAELCVL